MVAEERLSILRSKVAPGYEQNEKKRENVSFDREEVLKIVKGLR